MRRLLLGLGLFGLILVWALGTDTAGDTLCQTLRRQLPKQLGVDVGIGQCRIEPLSQSVKLVGLSVFESDRDQAPLLAADEAEISIRSVFFESVTLNELKLKRPRMRVEISPNADRKTTLTEGCPLKLLERVKVNHLGVEGAMIQLIVPGKGVLKLEQLDFKAERKSKVLISKAELKSGSLALSDGRYFKLGAMVVESELDVDDEVLALQRAELGVDGARVTASGTVESLCEKEPNLQLTGQVFFPLSMVQRFVKGAADVDGQVWSRVQVSGKPSAPKLRADVQGNEVRWGAFKPGNFTARLASSGKVLEIEDFFSKAGDGTVRVSGDIKLERGLPSNFKVQTERASLGNILGRASIPGSWVELLASVKGQLSGTLTPRPNLGGAFEARADDFLLASRAYDKPPETGLNILRFASADAQVQLHILGDRVEMKDIEVRVAPQGTRVYGAVTIYYDMKRGIEVHAAADPLMLGDFGHIAGLTWAGSGTASVDISGAFADISIGGELKLRDFVFEKYSLGVVEGPLQFRGTELKFGAISGQKGKTPYFGDLSLFFRPKTDLYVRSKVRIPSGRTEDVVDILAGLTPTLQQLQGGVLTGQVMGVGIVDSPAPKLKGQIDLSLTNTRLSGRALGAGSAQLSFDDGVALELERLALKGPLGTSSARGRWNFAGPMSFQVAIEKGSLSELFNNVEKLSGPFDAQVVVSGDTSAPIIDGTLRSDDVQLDESPLGGANLTGRWVGDELKITGAPFDDALAQLVMQMRAPFPWTLALKGSLNDLTPWFSLMGLKQGFDGTVKGTLNATGNLESNENFSFQSNLERVSLSRGDLAVANEGPVKLSYARGQLLLQPTVVRGTNTELSAEGTWGPTTADIDLNGKADLRLVESFSTLLERTGGQLELTASVVGSVKQPALVGGAEVKDAHFTVRDQPYTVQKLNGHLEFSQSRVLLQRFEGFLNDGRLSARGDIKLEGHSLKTLEVAVDLEQAIIPVREQLPATVTGSLLAYGKLGAFQLSGALDVVKLRYTQNVELETLLKNVRGSNLLPTDDRKPDEWLRLDVDLTLGEDVGIDNNLAEAQMAGRLKLTGTNVKPVLLGTIEARPGATASFRGNVLNIGKGVIILNGNVPTFDLNAQSQVREYLVTIKGFGRLDDPKVTLQAQPALAEAEVLTLLTLGITSKESVGGVGSASLAGEVLLNASGLDTHLQRFLNTSVGLKNQQIHLSTTFNPATGQAEPSVSWESNVLSDKLKVGVTQPVTGRGTKAKAEYQFNDRVSARAQWDNQTQETSFGNPGVDFKFHFEWQ